MKFCVSFSCVVRDLSGIDKKFSVLKRLEVWPERMWFNRAVVTQIKRKQCCINGDGVVVRASASQSVDLGFIPLVESYQKTLKNGIHSFPAWRSAFRGGCGEQAGKLACCVPGQGT